MHKILSRFFCLSLTILLVFYCSLTALASPKVSGECACLYLPQNKLFVCSKNADLRHPMASTTKIITALVVLENCALSEKVKISPEATGIEGSSVYLKADSVFTVESLLYALLLASANDAAAAIAIHTAGSIENFAVLMNERVASLGATNTHLTNPHGLADPQHYTTASDLAIITAAALENEAFAKIVSTKSKVITSLDGECVRTLSNHNRLLRNYKDCVGVKTGFTKDSGRCLVSAAKRDGLLLIAVTLDASDDWHDHTAMLDYGFSLYEGRVYEKESISFTVPVIGGERDHIRISARNDLAFPILRGTQEPTTQVEINRFAVAPIKAGATLGVVRYKQGDKTLAVLPLLAEEGVAAKKTDKNLLDKIKDLLNL